jgi:putative DNA primase/helicase
MGSITVLAGDPGLGKSLLSLDLAALLSRGELGPRSAGGVLLLTAEDSRTHTVRPRLEAAGADLARVHFGSICRDRLETTLALPDDVDALRELIESTRTQLVVIDPLMAHLASNVNSWKDQMIRQALAPLNALADATATAILIVAHLNKGQGTDPLQRLGGSIGIPAAARSVLLLGRDPDDPDGEQGSQRVLAHVKSNVSELSPSLRFNVEAAMAGSTCVETARIVQAGVSRYTGSDLLVSDRRERGSKLAEAVAFLDRALAESARPVQELKAEAKEFGITEQTLARAKQKLGVDSVKLDFGRGWAWRSPEKADDAAETRSSN